MTESRDKLRERKDITHVNRNYFVYHGCARGKGEGVCEHTTIRPTTGPAKDKHDVNADRGNSNGDRRSRCCAAFTQPFFCSSQPISPKCRKRSFVKKKNCYDVPAQLRQTSRCSDINCTGVAASLQAACFPNHVSLPSLRSKRLGVNSHRQAHGHKIRPSVRARSSSRLIESQDGLRVQLLVATALHVRVRYEVFALALEEPACDKALHQLRLT